MLGAEHQLDVIGKSQSRIGPFLQKRLAPIGVQNFFMRAGVSDIQEDRPEQIVHCRPSVKSVHQDPDIIAVFYIAFHVL